MHGLLCGGEVDMSTLSLSLGVSKVEWNPVDSWKSCYCTLIRGDSPNIDLYGAVILNYSGGGHNEIKGKLMLNMSLGGNGFPYTWDYGVTVINPFNPHNPGGRRAFINEPEERVLEWFRSHVKMATGLNPFLFT